MALPPRDMHTRCLRCGVALDDDAADCPSCGANRAVEMAVAAELNPTVSALQRWLVILGALSVAVGALLWEHMSGRGDGAMWMVVGPALANGVALFVAAALARRAPFAISVAVLVLFGLSWISHAIADPAGAIAPNFPNAIRLMFAIVVIGAVQSGYKARRIRAIADLKVAEAAAR